MSIDIMPENRIRVLSEDELIKTLTCCSDWFCHQIELAFKYGDEQTHGFRQSSAAIGQLTLEFSPRFITVSKGMWGTTVYEYTIRSNLDYCPTKLDFMEAVNKLLLIVQKAESNKES